MAKELDIPGLFNKVKREKAAMNKAIAIRDEASEEVARRMANLKETLDLLKIKIDEKKDS